MSLLLAPHYTTFASPMNGPDRQWLKLQACMILNVPISPWNSLFTCHIESHLPSLNVVQCTIPVRNLHPIWLLRQPQRFIVQRLTGGMICYAITLLQTLIVWSNARHFVWNTYAAVPNVPCSMISPLQHTQFQLAIRNDLRPYLLRRAANFCWSMVMEEWLGYEVCCLEV
jgi:hypothetical protein